MSTASSVHLCLSKEKLYSKKASKKGISVGEKWETYFILTKGIPRQYTD
jgi:hypothetical protein